MDNQKDKFIIVNTRKKDWDKETISYKEVVILAFGSYSEDESVVYTVTYSNGPHGHSEGSLVKGQSVKVKDGMIFNVSQTNRS
jgi:multiubiquitin